MKYNYKDKRPKLKSVYKKKQFTKDDFMTPEIKEVIDVINTNNRHGGAKFYSFKFKKNKKLDWFLVRNRYSEVKFFEKLLQSKVYNNDEDTVKINEGFEDNLCNRRKTSLTLDGYIADILHFGGAYRNVEDQKEAKRLGNTFCNSLFGNRYEDIDVYTSNINGILDKLPEIERHKDEKGLEDDYYAFPTMHIISDYFEYIDVWSYAVTIIDKKERRISFLMITDTD